MVQLLLTKLPGNDSCSPALSDNICRVQLFCDFQNEIFEHLFTPTKSRCGFVYPVMNRCKEFSRLAAHFCQDIALSSVVEIIAASKVDY